MTTRAKTPCAMRMGRSNEGAILNVIVMGDWLGLNWSKAAIRERLKESAKSTW